MTRRRVWTFADGRPPQEDYCQYRLSLPLELEHYLEAYGSSVLGLFDNKELNDTDLSGHRMYLAARFG